MYAHLKRISVEPGSSIDQETVIAQVGMTGYTTGPHLHLEIYNKGRAQNPRLFLGY
jgi:murein DD-endopeptidase MepM/ murein hydrolase activator NlpD